MYSLRDWFATMRSAVTLACRDSGIWQERPLVCSMLACLLCLICNASIAGNPAKCYYQDHQGMAHKRSKCNNFNRPDAGRSQSSRYPSLLDKTWPPPAGCRLPVSPVMPLLHWRSTGGRRRHEDPRRRRRRRLFPCGWPGQSPAAV